MAATWSPALDRKTVFVVVVLCATARLAFGQYDTYGEGNVTTPAAATEGDGGASTGTPSVSEVPTAPPDTTSPIEVTSSNSDAETTTAEEAQHSTQEQRDSTLMDEMSTTTGSQQPERDATVTTGAPEVIVYESNLQQVYSLGPMNASAELRLDNCGSRGRIIGGHISAVPAWPWAVAVKDKFSSHYCGGVVISSRHVLTAAHCIDHPDLVDRLPLKVTVGDYDLSTSEESESRTEWVHEAFKHNQYNQPSSYNNDIGVLVVQDEIDTGIDVTPVCLPSAQLNLPVGTEMFVVGWGATVYNGPVVNELRQVKLTLLDNSRCTAVYSEFKADRMFCVGDLVGGKDACQGDSGGPLLYKDTSDNKWYVVGVVSFGSRCGEAQYPGVYTSVQFHLGLLNWALQNT
ncbi:proclotting enzyme-like [Portunus trituberculatus]|uniref:limulus clotting factor C n=1 Tax=Portunus trituberculatus TaxID=210409 RepID=A0A5B7GXP2_PORTR|nr:proclotting enzyme-like [Portunus trituberculatus]MPC62433.1 Proclotting enzyme [Portunus trituberculatus]